MISTININLTGLSFHSITLFFLVLFGFFALLNDFDHVNAQAQPSDCDRQTFSLVDCPGSFPGDEEADNDEDGIETDNGNDDGQNIEQQIPSVIPFP